MWDGLFMLLTLSTVMFVASFLAGSLPLSFTLSQRQLRFISALGTGVLVGTALIVIIPEGVETLYSSSSHTHSHIKRSVSDVTVSGPISPNHIWHRRTYQKDYAASFILKRDSTDETQDHAKWPRVSKEHIEQPVEELSVPRPPEEHDNSQISPEEPEGHSSHSPHAWIGLSLILGFILMYLIDVLPSAIAARHAFSPHTVRYISLSNLSQPFHHTPSPSLPPSSPNTGPTHNPQGTTIGLVIHAVADGIALGASTSSTKLGVIVFLALMLHKAPAAFGLTSVLLKQGLSKRVARTHLIVFSLAAPVGAFATWLTVQFIGGGNLSDEDGVGWATGVVLLFSGGTFLYVAMHAMQSTKLCTPPDLSLPPPVYGSPERSSRANESQNSLGQVGVIVLGMLLPLLAQAGHVH